MGVCWFLVGCALGVRAPVTTVQVAAEGTGKGRAINTASFPCCCTASVIWIVALLVSLPLRFLSLRLLSLSPLLLGPLLFGPLLLDLLSVGVLSLPNLFRFLSLILRTDFLEAAVLRGDDISGAKLAHSPLECDIVIRHILHVFVGERHVATSV